ncbi:MAG: hypothetical protein ACK5HS_00830 [Mycoplasmatales bacterium]
MEKLKSQKVIIGIVIIFVAIFLIGLVMPEESTEVEKDTPAETSNSYKKSGSWAMMDGYLFAIENEDFDGDVYQAGDYHFSTSGATKNKPAAVYNIYTSKELYTESADVINNANLKCSAGGVGNIECDASLEKGDYVYIEVTENVSGSSGMIKFKLNK